MLKTLQLIKEVYNDPRTQEDYESHVGLCDMCNVLIGKGKMTLDDKFEFKRYLYDNIPAHRKNNLYVWDTENRAVRNAWLNKHINLNS